MEKIAALEDAIAKKSLVGIYSVFYTIAHGDPNFSTGKFREVLRYVKSKHIEGFMEAFDGEEFEPEENWDKEYWALVASSLMDNFCEERISHLEQVGRKVYPIKPAGQPAPSSAAAVPHAGSRPASGGAGLTGRGTGPRRGSGLISEEEKRQVRSDHARARRKKEEGFLGKISEKIFGPGPRR